jgi:hypothetical protein
VLDGVCRLRCVRAPLHPQLVQTPAAKSSDPYKVGSARAGLPDRPPANHSLGCPPCNSLRLFCGGNT